METRLSLRWLSRRPAQGATATPEIMAPMPTQNAIIAVAFSTLTGSSPGVAGTWPCGRCKTWNNMTASAMNNTQPNNPCPKRGLALEWASL